MPFPNILLKEIENSKATEGRRRWAAALLIKQFIAMWGAFLVLAPSINWPASLELAPAEIFPLIRSNATAVMIGYSSYLIHALVLIPIAALLPSALGMQGVSGRISLLFGVLAGIAKALGIVRWIFLMPGLATAYLAPETSEITRQVIGEIYKAFNAYLGGLGEILGVGLFAGIWSIVLSTHLLRTGYRKLGVTGMVAAALLFSTLLSLIGIELPVLLTLSGIFWQFWTFSLAVTLLRRPT